ncbi:MAG: thioether cross-link-forming SCIFF peptide maturase, partial [Dialister micraerophilus]|nr:thioether cross-link-forming SCIFF peptide maturase [Dialister micraerophilus]
MSIVTPMIHRFKQHGMNIVLDVNSGIVHVVDQITYDVLEFYKGTNRSEVFNKLCGKYNKDELIEVMDEA